MTHPPTLFDIPAEMRAFAEQSFEQAKRAFDRYMGAAHTTLSTFEGQSQAAQAGAKDVSEKIMAFADQNVTTAFDFAQKLVRAKDPQTLFELHREFIQRQMEVLSEQAKILGQAASQAAKDSLTSKR